jgi:FkbM family methyltransferase
VTPRPTDALLPDERAGAGRENLDAAHIAGYDARVDTNAADEVALLRRFGLNEQSVAVDLGAGTGQVALALAAACRQVVAVDVSPAMLRHLRDRLARSGVENVDVVEAGFLTYEHQGEPADVVYSRWALHHLTDFWKSVALTRMHDLLAPGGLLRLVDVVFDFEPAEALERLDAWCASAGQGVADGWDRRELEEHVRDEASTYTWLLEPMIERAGFTLESIEHSDDGIFAEYVARRP